MPLVATPARLHRLVYAKLLAGEKKLQAFVAADPRTDVDVWRAFAAATLFPLAAALAVLAACLAIGAGVDESPRDVVPLAFLAGTVALAVGALVAARKRSLLPGAVGFVLAGGAVFANIVGVRAFRREEEVAMLVVAVVTVVTAWIIARTTPAYASLEQALPEDEKARAFFPERSRARTVAAIAVWVVGVPLAFGMFVALMDTRGVGVGQLVLGVALLVPGALITRSTRPLFVARQAGLLAFLAGSLYVCGALAEHLGLDRDVRTFALVPVLVVAWLAVRSWPVRALWGAVLAIVVLVGFEELSLRPGDVERADDLVMVVLAAVATFAMTRGRFVRPAAVAACLALLVFGAVELPQVGSDLALGLGTFTSLGVLACLVALVLVVVREKRARAIVGALVFFAGTLVLDIPALLVALLVVALARQARVRTLEVAGVAAALGALFARLDVPWVILGERALALGIAAALALGAGVLLRRLPTPP